MRYIITTLIATVCLTLGAPLAHADTTPAKPTTVITVTPTVVVYKGADGKTSTTTTIPTPNQTAAAPANTPPVGQEKGKNEPPLWFGFIVGGLVASALWLRLIVSGRSTKLKDALDRGRASTYSKESTDV